MDVDEWRAEFTAKLRETGTALLADLLRRKDELKPGEIAYALSVTVDKQAALDGRSQLASNSVNIQVNNYGTAPTKSSLLDQLASLQTGRAEVAAESVKSTS